MSKIHVTTTLNGDPTEFLCDPEDTLLDVLRDRLGMTGSKEGCGTGDCGACSVTLDGRLVCSCLVLGAEAAGRSVTTIEGMADGGTLHPLAAQVHRTCRPAMRHLHAGHSGGGQVALGAQPGPDRGRDTILAGRQPLPLHRL